MKVPPLIFSLIALGIASCTSYAPLPLSKHANFPPSVSAISASVLSPLSAAIATYALNFPV